MKLIYRQTSLRALVLGSIILVPLLGLLALLEFGAIGTFLVTSDSMAPTLLKGDRVLVDLRESYVPSLGDIVIFRNPREADRPRMVKRIIGRSGDLIEVRDGRIYRNDEPLLDEFLDEKNRKIKVNDGVFPVPGGSFFAAGDNRNFSFDSFNFGTLNEEDVEGRVLLIFWPRGRWDRLENPRLVPTH